jgi:hypothetical protein
MNHKQNSLTKKDKIIAIRCDLSAGRGGVHLWFSTQEAKQEDCEIEDCVARSYLKTNQPAIQRNQQMKE